jgi:hypothetical protein
MELEVGIDFAPFKKIPSTSFTEGKPRPENRQNSLQTSSVCKFNESAGLSSDLF